MARMPKTHSFARFVQCGATLIIHFHDMTKKKKKKKANGVLIILSFQQPSGVGFIMIPSIWMRKLRLRELKLLRAGSRGTKF